MVPKTLTLATRTSRLALAQAQEAIQALRRIWPDQTFTTIPYESPGDRDLSTPLTDLGVPDDFFTRDIDDALIHGHVDLAVHSAKDLPHALHPDLEIGALLPARDIRDALVYRPGYPLDQPPGVIGTSSPKRQIQIRKIYPAATTKTIRGTIDQRLAQLDRSDFDAILVAACALERLGLTERIHTYLPYDPAPQQGRLAIVVRSDRTELLTALHALDVRRSAGLVAIVGCPADVGSLSLRARDYLHHADVIFHDRLIPDEVLWMIRDKAHPVGKAGGDTSTPQHEIHRLMLDAAEQGRLVVRLKGGDPLIFAHLAEELEFLASWNLRVDLVPTLTAAQVAATRIMAPLTHRGDGGQLHLVAAPMLEDRATPPLPGPGTGSLAIYMGGRLTKVLHERLRQAGWPDDEMVWIAERLGYLDEAIHTMPLAELAHLTPRTPATILLGPKSPAITPRTLFVGTDPGIFLNEGPLIHWPVIKLVSRPLAERVAALEECGAEWDGIIFPSRFAVNSFMDALLASRDARDLHGKRCLAVGPATADALRDAGIRADAQVDHCGGLRALVKTIPPAFAGNYLYPCSSVAPITERVATLANAGIRARPMTFYENRRISHHRLPTIPFHRVLFTSASTVDAYFDLYPDELTADREWRAVGPSTAKALHDRGLTPQIISKPQPCQRDQTGWCFCIRNT